jgi:hypothetical protein
MEIEPLPYGNAVTKGVVMRYRQILSFNPLASSATSVAIFFASLAISADAAAADCMLSEKNVVLARVVTKEAKLYYVSGPRKGASECPSATHACRLKAYLVPGDKVLTNATDDPYICARFKSQSFVETSGYLPRAALEIVPSEDPSIQKWNGTWRRDTEAEIVLKAGGDEVSVSGNATWGGSDPQRVKRGAVNTGELEGSFRPRGQVLAIGYDPDRSGFQPTDDTEADICAAKIELYDRYLLVEDNGKCGGLNVSFNGLYVRTNSKQTVLPSTR